jgi:large-conductance mechanosensitive channel
MLHSLSNMDGVSLMMFCILALAAGLVPMWAVSKRQQQTKAEYDRRMDEAMQENAKHLSELKEMKSLLTDIRDILAKIK